MGLLNTEKISESVLILERGLTRLPTPSLVVPAR